MAYEPFEADIGMPDYKIPLSDQVEHQLDRQKSKDIYERIKRGPKGPVPQVPEPSEGNLISGVMPDPVDAMVRTVGMNLPHVDVQKDLTSEQPADSNVRDETIRGFFGGLRTRNSGKSFRLAPGEGFIALSGMLPGGEYGNPPTSPQGDAEAAGLSMMWGAEHPAEEQPLPSVFQKAPEPPAEETKPKVTESKKMTHEEAIKAGYYVPDFPGDLAAGTGTNTVEGGDKQKTLANDNEDILKNSILERVLTIGAHLGLAKEEIMQGNYGPKILKHIWDDITTTVKQAPNRAADSDIPAAARVALAFASGGFARGALAKEGEVSLGVGSGRLPPGEKPPLTVIEGGLSKSEKLIDDLNTKLTQALKEGKEIDPSKAEEFTNLITRMKENATRSSNMSKSQKDIYLATQEGKPVDQVIADLATLKKMQDQFKDVREGSLAGLPKDLETLKAQVSNDLITQVEGKQIDLPPYLQEKLDQTWKDMVAEARQANLKPVEGGKGTKELIGSMHKKARDEYSLANQQKLEEPELIRQRALYAQSLRDAEKWHDAIVAVAKGAKRTDTPEQLNVISGMQAAVDSAMQRASDAKLRIDNFPKEVQLEMDLGRRGLKRPANQPARREANDVLTKELDQYEMNFGKTGEMQKELFTVGYGEVRAYLPLNEYGKPDLPVLDKMIQKVVGVNKPWRQLTTGEKRQVYNEVVSLEKEGSRKDLSAARTPDELLNYNEPYRPKSLRDLADAEQSSRMRGNKQASKMSDESESFIRVQSNTTDRLAKDILSDFRSRFGEGGPIDETVLKKIYTLRRIQKSRK